MLKIKSEEQIIAKFLYKKLKQIEDYFDHPNLDYSLRTFMRYVLHILKTMYEGITTYWLLTIALFIWFSLLIMGGSQIGRLIDWENAREGTNTFRMMIIYFINFYYFIFSPVIGYRNYLKENQLYRGY